MYWEDNHGFYPPVNQDHHSITYHGVTRNAYILWYSVIYIGQYFGNENISSCAFQPNRQRSSSRVVYCPSGWEQNGGDTGYDQVLVGYNNTWDNGINRSDYGLIPRPMHQWKNPDKLCILTDVNTGLSWGCSVAKGMTSLNYWKMAPAQERHCHISANVAFADGHARSTTEFDEELAADTILSSAK